MTSNYLFVFLRKCDRDDKECCKNAAKRSRGVKAFRRKSLALEQPYSETAVNNEETEAEDQLKSKKFASLQTSPKDDSVLPLLPCIGSLPTHPFCCSLPPSLLRI